MTKPDPSCGDCTLCCKVMAVEEIEKPADQWCVHCLKGHAGCGIYETRPQPCRDFECFWLQSQHRTGPNGETFPGGAMHPGLKPNKCKVVIDGNRHGLTFHVDPGYPGAVSNPLVQDLIEKTTRAGMVVFVVCGKKRTAHGPQEKILALLNEAANQEAM